MGKALQKGAGGAGCVLVAILQGALDKAIQGQQVVQTHETGGRWHCDTVPFPTNKKFALLP